MKETCYDCAWLYTEVDVSYRFSTCSLGSRFGAILPNEPAPACGEFVRRSGISVWDASNEETKKALMEIYRKSAAYNPEISPEQLLRSIDSAISLFSK